MPTQPYSRDEPPVALLGMTAAVRLHPTNLR